MADEKRVLNGVLRLFKDMGDGTFAEVVYNAGGAGGGSANLDFDMNGVIIAGRMYHGISLGGAANNDWKNITLWKTDMGDVSTASTQNDSYVEGGPWILLRYNGAGSHTGTNTLDSVICYNTVTQNAGATYTLGPRVTAYGATRSSPPNPAAFNVNPTTTLNSKTSAELASMSVAELVALVKTALTPKAGGAVADRGALNTDGSWRQAA